MKMKTALVDNVGLSHSRNQNLQLRILIRLPYQDLNFLLSTVLLTQMPPYYKSLPKLMYMDLQMG